MSDVSAAVPAGWYADPHAVAALRWWDGTAWTAHVHHDAAVVAADARVAAGTPTSTPWIWVIVFLPLLALVSLFTFDPSAYIEADASEMMNGLGIYTDPWYLGSIALSFAIYGVSVWFAYLDFAALGRLGYTRRFHWAWLFLSSLLYVIGRSVMVRRAAGRGFAPLWAAIAVTVTVAIIAVIWSVWVVVVMLNSAADLIGGM